uniref:Immunoglobulin superfamily member 9B n=1 Tax=Callorhinchus milii TaxID=7868 RepID=A0A4W3HB38_CALMI
PRLFVGTLLCAIGCRVSAREEPEFETARAGDSIILGCDVVHPVSGQQPPYVVEWFKFGVPIPIFIKFGFYPPHVDPEYAGRASLYEKASLRIDQLRSEDQGWYECKVLMLDQQYDTFHNGSWVYLTVNAPPTFTETPSPYVEAKEGSSITLTCTAFGNPKPVVSWLREEKLLANDRKYTVSDGSLTISSVGRKDRGAYTCRAYSIQGEAVHTTRLLVQGPPFIISPPENITVNISQDALFTCQAEAYPGNLTYIWFWEEDNVFFKNDLKMRVRILIDGTLIIFHVKPEDAGKYTCVPSNSLGRSPSASSYLTVQYPARVINMPSIIYVPVGMPGYIKCPVDADPPVTQVKWTKDGRPLKIEKYPGWRLLDDGTIRLEEATEETLGTYTCVPYNALGTMGQSTPAQLVLKDPPYFTVLPGWEYRQEVGRELVIPCAAAGDPFPVITWRKVGKPSKSKHNILPSGSLQFKALSKEDHGEWECVATNVVTSITASTHLTVIGTSPYAPMDVRVTATMTSTNISWDPAYDGGYEQTFTVWYGLVVKRAMLGPHDWRSLPVTTGLTWLLVEGLEPETAYQFSVLAHNKLGTGPFSEVITVNTLAFPITTREPLVLLSPPRCLTANRTQQGVLLSWISPANHTYPIDRYIMEFRLGDKWDILDEDIPGSETELLTKELNVDSWYEFHIIAVMQELISEPSNVVGVSSSDIFSPADLPEEGLARPVVAGIVATICFLAAAVLFSTLAACFVNRQRRRKNKRKRDPPLSITHCRKSVESPSSSGKVSPESIRTLRAPSESSEDAQAIHTKMSLEKEREMSLYKKTKRAITSRKYSVSKHEAEAEATTPIELISRGPDGRFIMDPMEIETSLKTRRIEGFPFAEETDTYPEFRQSDEENDETVTSSTIMGLKSQLSPLSSSQESYLQPPAYSPRFQKPEGGINSRLQATGQIRRPPKGYPQGQFYSYLTTSSVDPDGQPFYMPDISPLSSVMSSPPPLREGPYGQPTLPEGHGEIEIQHLVASSSTLPLTHTPTALRSPDPWRRKELSISSIESSPVMFSHHQETSESTLPKAGLPRGGPPSSLQVPAPYHSVLHLEEPKSWTSKSPSKTKGSVSLAPKQPGQPMQQTSQGQLKHTSHGMGAPTLPYTESAKQAGPSGTSTFSLDTRWYEPRPRPRASPRQGRRTEASLHQVVLQPSRLSPLSQSPMSSHHVSPEISSRPRPRPSFLQHPHSIFPAGVSVEMSEITLQPPTAVSLSRRSSPSSSPAQSSTAGQGSRRGSPSYRPPLALTPSSSSYTGSPSPATERSEFYSQIPSQRRRSEDIPPFEHPPSHLSTSGKPSDTHGAAAVPESFEALRYQRVRKSKEAVQITLKARRKNSFSTSQVQQPHESQVLQSQDIVYLQKKKRHSLQDSRACFSALKEEFHKYRHQLEDEKTILVQADYDEQEQATLL